MADNPSTPFTVLPAGTHRRMPWRNGGGWTSEIFAWPDPDDWHWRLSVADVEQGGPFSTFPGVDRTIVLLHGGGFSLTVGGRAAETIGRPFEPFEFAGDDPADCSLLDGPVQDLNLMVRRGSPRRRLSIVEFDGTISLGATSTENTTIDDGRVDLFVVLAGQLGVDDRGLGRLDAVRLDAAACRLMLTSAAPEAAVIALAIADADADSGHSAT